MIVMLDDPKPAQGTYGYATAGWNVTPTAGNIIERIAPLLGVKSDFNEAEAQQMGELMQLTSISNEAGEQ
jgi:hypothetical protein